MCTPKCLYFPDVGKIADLKEIDGVKHCKLNLTCGYSSKRIKNWNTCFREKGPLIPSNIPMIPALDKKSGVE